MESQPSHYPLGGWVPGQRKGQVFLILPIGRSGEKDRPMGHQKEPRGDCTHSGGHSRERKGGSWEPPCLCGSSCPPPSNCWRGRRTQRRATHKALSLAPGFLPRLLINVRYVARFCAIQTTYQSLLRPRRRTQLPSHASRLVT